AGSLVYDARQRRGCAADHHDRSPLRKRNRPTSPERVDGTPGRPVRLLPVRSAHDGGRTAREDEESVRRGDRQRHDAHLPLRNVRANSRGDSRRGGGQSCHVRRRRWIVSAPISRRSFVSISAGAGAGLLLGIRIDSSRTFAFHSAPSEWTPNAWLRVSESGIATVIAHKAEMGQGAFTALPMIVAEELDAKW